MGIRNQKLEMLFLSPNYFGNGFGKELLTYGFDKYHINCLTVSEQNPKALHFFQRMGFETTGRSAIDEEDNPYPILYMRLTNKKAIE